MKLTQAQKDALVVLGDADGKALEAWKRRTQSYPRRVINSRAAGSLVQMGLANIRMPLYWSPYTHDYKYTITDKGREVLSAL